MLVFNGPGYIRNLKGQNIGQGQEVKKEMFKNEKLFKKLLDNGTISETSKAKVEVPKLDPEKKPAAGPSK